MRVRVYPPPSSNELFLICLQSQSIFRNVNVLDASLELHEASLRTNGSLAFRRAPTDTRPPFRFSSGSTPRFVSKKQTVICAINVQSIFVSAHVHLHLRPRGFVSPSHGAALQLSTSRGRCRQVSRNASIQPGIEVASLVIETHLLSSFCLFPW